MSDIFFVRTDCRACGSTDVGVVGRLAPMAIATPNFDIPDSDRDHPVYRTPVPLELSLCGECGLLQVMHVGNPNIQYPNYTYETNHSLGLVEHFRGYADDVVAELGDVTGKRVVEIGSNDGTLLSFFKNHGMVPLGVDPAEKIAHRATENGIPTIAAFFDAAKGKEIAEAYGLADLIVANNVVANIDDLNSFADGIKALLHETGRFVFETQYGADVVERLLLDTIYHEHLTYMNIRPIVALCDRHDLKVMNVRRIDTKGGSIRVTVMHKDATREPEPVVGEMVQSEHDKGHYGQELYSEFQNRITTLQEQFRTLVAEARATGKKIAGYGVSVGTSVLLPTLGLEDEIDVFFDDNPLRGTRFSGPGYDIPIRPGSELAESSPGLTIIFAWRYADPIIAKHDRYISDGGLFAIPLPALSTKP